MFPLLKQCKFGVAHIIHRERVERIQKNQGETYTTTTTLPINEYGDKLQMADGFGGGDTIMLFTPHARVYLLIELTALSGEKKSKEEMGRNEGGIEKRLGEVRGELEKEEIWERRR